MTPNEETYLARYRELSFAKHKIVGMIGELHRICESLKDWEKTAEELSQLGSESTRPEWSEDRLNGIIKLRDSLLEYHRRAEDVQRVWNMLKEPEKLGLADPYSLRPIPKT